jgi:hypothetical protein
MQKYCACHYPTIVKDSVITTEKTDTFYIPVNPDTTYAQVPFYNEDTTSRKVISAENKHSKVKLVYAKKTLLLTLETKKDSIQAINKTIQSQATQTKLIPYQVSKKVPKWAWWSLALNLIFSAFFIFVFWLKVK